MRTYGLGVTLEAAIVVVVHVEIYLLRRWCTFTVSKSIHTNGVQRYNAKFTFKLFSSNSDLHPERHHRTTESLPPLCLDCFNYSFLKSACSDSEFKTQTLFSVTGTLANQVLPPLPKIFH